MTHQELRDQYDLYAIGAADDAATAEIRDHLARGCEECMLQMKRARELAVLLGVSADPAAPSPGLRRRILAASGFEQRRFGWAPWLGLATALSLFAAFYFSTRERQFAEEVLALRNQMRRQTIELTQLNEAFAILSGPSTIEVGFGAGPKGKAYIDRSRGILLIANSLPPTAPGKTYEMWTIPKGGKPVPAGLFQAQPGGTAMHVQPGPVDPNLAVVAVTIEDEGGAQQPTLPIILAASLQ